MGGIGHLDVLAHAANQREVKDVSGRGFQRVVPIQVGDGSFVRGFIHDSGTYQWFTMDVLHFSGHSCERMRGFQGTEAFLGFFCPCFAAFWYQLIASCRLTGVPFPSS